MNKEISKKIIPKGGYYGYTVDISVSDYNMHIDGTYINEDHIQFLKNYDKLPKYINILYNIPISYIYMINFEKTVNYSLQLLVENCGLDYLQINTDDFYNLMEMLQGISELNSPLFLCESSGNTAGNYTSLELSYISKLSEIELYEIVKNAFLDHGHHFEEIKDTHDKGSLLFVILTKGIYNTAGDFGGMDDYKEIKIYNPRTIVGIILLYHLKNSHNPKIIPYNRNPAYIYASYIRDKDPRVLDFLEKTNEKNILSQLKYLNVNIAILDEKIKNDFTKLYIQTYIPAVFNFFLQN